MKKIKLEIEYKEEPMVGGEFEDMCNWLSKCPIPKERVKHIEK